MHVVDFTIGGPPAVELTTIPGDNSFFTIAVGGRNWMVPFIVDNIWHLGGAAYVPMLEER